ncbi:MAG: hypothetical protein NW226_11295, partial [Microscillaceae bacterium]|nr:hypothetical protein [Microscillaceae bacterium]
NIDPSKFSGKPLLIPLKTKPVEPTLKEKWTLTEEDKQEMLIHPSDRVKENNYLGTLRQPKPSPLIDLTKPSKAWFVHGTWQDFNYFQQSLIDRTVKTFGSTKDTRFKWYGDNTPGDRMRGAISLAEDILKNHVSGELIVIMTHSHGGNVAKWAIKELVQKLNIDASEILLITINLPVRTEYVTPKGITHINVRSKELDWVAYFGGVDHVQMTMIPTFWDWEDSFRDDPDASANIVYEDQYPTEYLKTITEYGQIVDAFPKFNDAFANHNGPWKKNVQVWFPIMEQYLKLFDLQAQREKLYLRMEILDNQIADLEKQSLPGTQSQKILEGIQILIDIRSDMIHTIYALDTEINNLQIQIKK